MIESKYDSAIAEVMTHCASDSQIQNALADQTPDCIIAPGSGYGIYMPILSLFRRRRSRPTPDSQIDCG